MTDGQFSAADSALGYLYQCRLALLWALERLRQDQDFLLSIETLDDVVFEDKNTDAATLLQTKHHRRRAANLTDASEDLWKTLRIWSEHKKAGRLLPSAALVLVTTAQVGASAAVSYLRMQNRDADRALSILLNTARTSGSKANKDAYKAFLALDAEAQKSLLRAVVVLDASPGIAAVQDAIRAEVRWAADQAHRDAFVSRLEGWWFGRVVRHLQTTGDRPPVLSEEIDAHMSVLREQFKTDSLPIDSDLPRPDPSKFGDAAFVAQLRLIDVGDNRILTAIADFHRAFVQRSRWIRDDLLLVGELDRYEDRLIEAWKIKFDRMAEDLGREATEKEKVKFARRVYEWIEDSLLPIRPRISEGFVCRGSFHMLADKLRVGWHVDFVDRLRHLLEPGRDA